MTDPTQFLVQQQNVHKILTHEGVLGTGRDFLSGQSCSIHLYSDRHKRSYVMQQFNELNQTKLTQKMIRITKAVHNKYISNVTRVCFISTRRITKQKFQLNIFYDVTGIYGYSLEYILKMKVKNEEKFSDEEIIGFFWQIADFLYFNGQHTGQFLEITPVNIFTKAQDYYGYNFFPNNFGLNFEGTKWQKNYHNPRDKFWNGERTLQAGISTTMFTFGMVLLQLCSLKQPNDMYENGQINEKVLKKRIEGIKITNSPTICSLISSMLILDESQRLKINNIYQDKDLLKLRKVASYSNKTGFFNYKFFQGIVSFDKRQGIGEAIDDNTRLFRGRFIDGKLEGLGMRQNNNDEIQIGIFEKGLFKEGSIIKKSEGIEIMTYLGTQSGIGKGIKIRLNINNDKSNKSVIAFEGEYENNKMSSGKVYFYDGEEKDM